MRLRLFARRSACFLWLLLLSPLPVMGADENLPALAGVDSRIAELKKAETPDPSQEATLAALAKLREALSHNEQLTQSSATYQKEIDAAPAALNKAEADLAKWQDSPAPDASGNAASGMKREEIEAQLADFQARQAANQSRLTELQSAKNQRKQRRIELPDELAAAQRELQDSTLPPKPAPAAPEADQIEWQTALARLTGQKLQVDTLLLEQQKYAVTDALLDKQLELAKAAAEKLAAGVKLWQQTLEERRSTESRETKEQTKSQAKKFQNIPELAKIAETNAGLAEQSTRIVNLTNQANQSLETLGDQREQTRSQRENAQERLTLLKNARLRIDTKTAALLRRQRNQLPTPASLQAALEQNIRDLTNAQMELLEIDSQLNQLPADTKSEAADMLRELKSSEVTAAEISGLLDQRRDLLSKLHSDYQAYSATLRKRNRALEQTRDEVRRYSQYLDERLLWLPSAAPISASDLAAEWGTVYHDTTRHLPNLLPALGADLARRPLLWITSLAPVLTLFFLRRTAKRCLSELREVVASLRCTSILPTLQALLWTCVLVLPAPLLLAFLAWRIEWDAWSRGLTAVASFLLLTDGLRRLCAPDGILCAHFKMPGEATRHIFLHLHWFIPTMAVFTFFSFALPAMGGPPEAGRLSFIGGMLVLLVFAHLVFRPAGALGATLSATPWRAKLLHGTAIGIPLLYISGASLGYLTSTYTLRANTSLSIWLTLLVLFVMRLLFRWILVSRRRLAREQAVRKYQAMMAKREGLSEDPDALSLEEVEANAIDPVKVEEQTSRLVRLLALVIAALGLWAIWSPTLPALSVLDQVELYGGEGASADDRNAKSPPAAPLLKGEMTSDPAPAKAPDTATTPRRGITLQDVTLTLLILLLTFSAAHNIPGLVELSLLRRATLNPGSNYAITTILRYLIILTGLLLAFRRLGITWSSIQWLAAAVSLGIGFGLQEIFANFVAGIILLFERPLRIGDLVTIGDISGRVTRIQIRSTTIRQGNNRELIVPNKDLITGKLVNWTLSDTVVSFDLKLGLDCNSDVKQATAIIERLLAEHPHILSDPAPQVFFSQFGDFTLDLTVIAAVGSPSQLQPTRSTLHHQILDAFRDAGIDIAIPQRDIFIRALPEEFPPIQKKPDPVN